MLAFVADDRFWQSVSRRCRGRPRFERFDVGFVIFLCSELTFQRSQSFLRGDESIEGLWEGQLRYRANALVVGRLPAASSLDAQLVLGAECMVGPWYEPG